METKIAHNPTAQMASADLKRKEKNEKENKKKEKERKEETNKTKGVLTCTELEYSKSI